MVQTRSQTRLIAAANANQNVSIDITKHQKTSSTYLYRNFHIASDKNLKGMVDRFLSDKYLIRTQYHLKKNPLGKFWTHKENVLNEIKQRIAEMSLEDRIYAFETIMKNETKWTRFENLVKNTIIPNLKTINSVQGRLKLNIGITELHGADLSALSNYDESFYYFINHLNLLFTSILKSLNEIGNNPNMTPMEKAKNLHLICRIWTIAKRFITNDYAHTQNYNIIIHLIMKKMIELYNKKGFEVLLYCIAAYCPELVSNSMYPSVGKSGEFYKHPELAIREDDPDFGTLKKTYGKFYTM